MNILLRIYPGDDWCFLVANVLVQVTVVILAAWLLSQRASRWNPALRHTVYLVALTCVLFSPVLSCLMQATGISLATLRTAASAAPPAESSHFSTIPLRKSSLTKPRATTNRADSQVENLGTDQKHESVPMSDVAVPNILRAAGGGAVVIWALGAAWLVARWCYGLQLVSALRRDAKPLDDSALNGLLRQVRRALDTDHLPPVATSTGVDRPIMIGLIRPLVILPENVVETLNESELTDVLVHECAHAVCQHQVAGFLQRVAGVLFWPHPLVHLLNRELARAREEVCDNFVLRRNDARRYARTLLDLSQSLAGLSPKPLALGLFHNPWSLEDRVAGLLDRRRKTMIQVRRSTTIALTVALLLPTLVIAGTKVIEATPIEHRSVNKSVKEFPEKTDLSMPESAMAALSRGYARQDADALVGLTWAKVDPQAVAANRLPDSTAEGALDTEVVKVLTYRDDLAAVTCRMNVSLGGRPIVTLHFGRIDGQWKNFDKWKELDLSYESSSIEAAEQRFAADKDTLWSYFVQIREDVKQQNAPATAGDQDGSVPGLPSISAKQMEEIKQIQAKTWAIELHLDMSSQELPAVQYTVLDYDPVPGYLAQVKRMRKFNREQLEKADTKSWKDLQRSAAIEVGWNNGFKDVTGENLWLLTKGPGNTLSSNGREGRKWVVTKATHIDGQPVCWCIPVVVKIGKKVDVSFNRDNTFDLRAYFDEAMGEPDGRGDKEEPN